jgi:hypothetical protein
MLRKRSREYKNRSQEAGVSAYRRIGVMGAWANGCVGGPDSRDLFDKAGLSL